MNYIMMHIVLITMKCPTFQLRVTLNGPQLVKRYDRLYLNCSSDHMPIDSAAKIKINNVYYTSIRMVDGKCFSTDLQSECLPGICSCSEEDMWFTHFYNATQPESVIDISCSMIFWKQGTFSSNIQVKIIDFSGPELTTDLAFPLPAGFRVNFTCSVEVTKRQIKFIWDCLDNKAMTTSISNENETKFISIMTAILHVNHDGIICNCSANVEGYIATTSIQLEIDKKPNLHLEESFSCNSSSFAILSCVITSELPIYGFASWIHCHKGTFIRALQGHTKGNRSILHIEPCSYQNEGDYICVAWNEYAGTSVYANKTIKLFVNSAPVVIATNIEQKQNGSSLSIWFYSQSNTTTVWSHQRKLVSSSSSIIQTMNRITVQVQFYNKFIDCDGYMASIIFPSSITGHYEVLLRNKFSETRQIFHVKSTNSKELVASFDFRSLVFGISAFGIFIATTAGAAILFKRRHTNSVVHIVSPLERSTIPIYHSAPSTEPVVHIYDIASNSGYLEVVNSEYLYQQSDTSGSEQKESDAGSIPSTATVHIYEEIE